MSHLEAANKAHIAVSLENVGTKRQLDE